MRHKESVCMSKEKQEEFSLAMRHKESICESKEKQDKIFFSYHTYTRNIVIDLRIVKLIWNLSRGFFPSRRKGFPRKYLCFCA